MRVLLAVALATATAVHDAPAQCITNFCPPPPPPRPEPGPQHPGGGGGDSNNRTGWYILGGILAVVAGWAIKTQIFPDPPPGGPPPPRTLPPDQPLTQVQLPPPGAPPPPPPPGGGPAAPAGPATQALRRGFDLPPVGAPCVPNEIVLDVPATVSTATLDAIAARHQMTRLETVTIRLTGRTLHRWRIDGGGSLESMTRSLSGAERQIAGSQCNFIYALAQAQGQADAE